MTTPPAVATVRPDDTLRTAFERLAAGGQRLAVVLDGAGRVAGSVTDGAVRRAVLRGAALDGPVTVAISSEPVVVSEDTPPAELADLLESRRLPAVAVVDRDRRLVSLQTLASIGRAAPSPAVGVLMVGGRGERLRPFTDKTPKPLLRVGGTTIVERLIRSFEVAGVRDVFLTLNYKAEQFADRLGTGEELGVRLHYLHERVAMGTAGALSLLEKPTSPVLVSNGDLVTTVDFAAMVDYHWHHGAAVTVAGVEYTAEVPYGVLRTADYHLLRIEEKPQYRQLVSAGMYVLAPEVLRYVPAGTPFGMPDLIDAVTEAGLPVVVFPVLERWADIGSREELERVLFDSAVEEEGA